MSNNNTAISTTKTPWPLIKIHETRLLELAKTSSWNMADRGLLQHRRGGKKKPSNLRKKIDRKICNILKIVMVFGNKFYH